MVSFCSTGVMVQLFTGLMVDLDDDDVLLWVNIINIVFGLILGC